ncbi:hypothetical protein FA15DRAFT_664569 [Coprinopsis marcescibilis]|uniref:Uncharacterized protein n=1 Tax=Coprinopsis marcescibilis TaxID=230819 RepID=A0A5C3L8W5_COPMA|nr:hypothetical protein FA15DRAFT_664569 [Coprinopsis marcescibilis]
MDYSESADILGQPTLQISKLEAQGSKFSTATGLFYILLLSVCVFVGVRIRREVLAWQEKSYKLETRRRHGIPDNDRRPFNVAYAAAMLAREEREKQSGNPQRRTLSKPVQNPAAAGNTHDSHPDQTLRNRSDRFRSSASIILPGAYVPSYVQSSNLRNGTNDLTRPSPSRSAFNEASNPRKAVQQQAKANYQSTGLRRHAARENFNTSSDNDVQKRGFDDEGSDDNEPSKKTRIEGDDPIDGDEDALWHSRASSSKRPAKRTYGHDDEDYERIRDKRARKVSLEKNGRVVEYEDMDIDEEMDEVPDMASGVRGKKRDRAEAGSTFGGDDDSAPEDDAKNRHSRRKRRTFSKRKSEVGPFVAGHKRDRDIDLEDEEMGTPSEAGTLRKSRHKKGKRQSHVNEYDDFLNGSDISIDESLASSGSRRPRRIGEEWESNGVRYKIGLNGQRLRQELVKKARNKFVMPQDSVHPDRNAALEVFVETWLTEEEYQAAKDQMLLAWQDTPQQSAEPESKPSTPAPKPTPVRTVGKDLLWQSTSASPHPSPPNGSSLDSPLDASTIRPKGLRNSGRYSVGATGLRINTFEKTSSISARRIASTSLANASLASPSSSLSDKTNYVRPRNLSKWEKQEVEAKAMAQLRSIGKAESEAKEKAEREKADQERERQLREKLVKEQQEKERLERERVEKERRDKEAREREAREKEAKAREAAAAAAAAVPKVPTITVTQPADSKPAAPAPSAFSFGPSTSAAPAPAAPATQSTGQALTNAFFAPSAAPSNATAPKPEDKPAAGMFAFKPTAPAAPTAANSGFSFGPSSNDVKPAASPVAAPPAASTFSFGPSSNTAKPATAAPAGSTSSFPFGPSSSSTAAKPSPFGQPSNTEKKEQPAAPAGGLFSRLGPPSGAPATNGSVFGQPSGAPAAGGNVFGQPSASNRSAFGQPASNTAPTNGTTAPAANGGVKFSFGKPADGAPASSSSLSGALGDSNKPAAALSGGSVFGFNKTHAAPPVPADLSKPTPGMFSFTKSPGKSPEASKSAFGGATSNAGGDTAKSAFGGAGGTKSAFGSNEAPKSAFGPTPAFGSNNTGTFGSAGFGASNAAAGSSSTSSPFGQQSSVFGSSGTQDKGKEVPKPAFGGFGGSSGSTTNGSGIFGAGAGGGGAFGKPAGGNSNTTTTTPTAATTAPKFSFGPSTSGSGVTETPKQASGFGFGSGAATSTPAGNPPSSSTAGGSGFNFNFKGTAGATTTPQSGSAFGGPSQPASAFGFGTPTNNNSTSANVSTTPAGTPASVFSFGK